MESQQPGTVDLTIDGESPDEMEKKKVLALAGKRAATYNHLKQQEAVRGRIAEGLIYMLAVIILFAFLTLWSTGGQFSELEKLMIIVFGPVVALVGTATGYYFGGKLASAQNGESTED